METRARAAAGGGGSYTHHQGHLLPTWESIHNLLPDAKSEGGSVYSNGNGGSGSVPTRRGGNPNHNKHSEVPEGSATRLGRIKNTKNNYVGINNIGIHTLDSD